MKYLEVKIGMSVTLNGSSPIMTVTKIKSEKEVVVVWFNREKKLETASFPPDCLSHLIAAPNLIF